MSCPTCDHTMQAVDVSDSKMRYWCPRCGTIKTQTNSYTWNEVPSRYSLLLAAIDEIDATLRVPAAEYVPAIDDVFVIIDHLKQKMGLT